MCGEWFRALADISCKNKDWHDLYGPDWRQMAFSFFCTAHFAQFEHRWTCSDVNAIGINNSVRYALDLQSNFYVLPALSASSPLFDLASSHDWWLKLWVHNTRHGQLGFWFIRQTKAVSFHGVSDTWTTSPYLPHVIPLWASSADTCGFSRLTLCSCYLVVVQQNVTFIAHRLSKSVGSFLCGSVCDWWLSACL